MKFAAVLVAGALLVPWPARADGDTSPRGAGSAGGVIELERDIDIYAEPVVRRSGRRGVAARGARFRVLGDAAGPGCDRAWLRIAERAWLCGDATRPSAEPPTRDSLPRLAPDELLPERYIVTRDANAYESLEDAAEGINASVVRGVGGFVARAVNRDGKRFYRTKRGWVPASGIENIEPSQFSGVALDAHAGEARLAFVRAKRPRLYDARGRRLRDPAPARRTFLGPVGEPVSVRGERLVPIAGGAYMRAEHLALIERAALPAGVGAAERWIDVVLSEQVMVAYEGERPVFATLVSTSRSATPPGVYRVKKKRAHARLRAQPEYQRQWDVDVPWVITLEGPLAMHVAYWHEEFGRAFSAGCVNFAPRDARWVWDFTEPVLPPGWLRVYASDGEPGTIVRIRE